MERERPEEKLSLREFIERGQKAIEDTKRFIAETEQHRLARKRAQQKADRMRRRDVPTASSTQLKLR